MREQLLQSEVLAVLLQNQWTFQVIFIIFCSCSVGSSGYRNASPGWVKSLVHLVASLLLETQLVLPWLRSPAAGEVISWVWAEVCTPLRVHLIFTFAAQDTHPNSKTTDVALSNFLELTGTRRHIWDQPPVCHWEEMAMRLSMREPVGWLGTRRQLRKEQGSSSQQWLWAEVEGKRTFLAILSSNRLNGVLQACNDLSLRTLRKWNLTGISV